MASDLSSGFLETIDVLDDEKEEGEISLEDVSSSEEGGMGHLISSYVVGRTRACPDCKSWGECATWCNATYYPKSHSRRGKVMLDCKNLRYVSFPSTAFYICVWCRKTNFDMFPWIFLVYLLVHDTFQGLIDSRNII